MSKLHTGMLWGHQHSIMDDGSWHSSTSALCADAQISSNANPGVLFSDFQSASIFERRGHATLMVSPHVALVTDLSSISIDSTTISCHGSMVNSNLDSCWGSVMQAPTIQSASRGPGLSGTMDPTIVISSRLSAGTIVDLYSSRGSIVQAPGIQSSNLLPPVSITDATIVSSSTSFIPAAPYDRTTAATPILPLSNPPWALDSALVATPGLSRSGSWVTDVRFVADPIHSSLASREACWPLAQTIEIRNQDALDAGGLFDLSLATASPYHMESCGSSLYGQIDYQVVDISGRRRVFRYIYHRTISLLKRVLDLKEIGRRLLAFLDRRSPKNESARARLPKKPYTSLRKVTINLPLVC